MNRHPPGLLDIYQEPALFYQVPFSANYEEFQAKFVYYRLRELSERDLDLYNLASKYLVIDFDKLTMSIYHESKTELGVAPNDKVEAIFDNKLQTKLGRLYINDNTLVELERFVVNTLEDDLGL